MNIGKYLPFVIPVIVALFLLIFGYFYIQSGKNPLPPAKEVPIDLPDQTRIENLEASVSTLISQLNILKTSISTASSQVQSSASDDYRIRLLETSVLELKARVAALEKPVITTVPASLKSPLYIPLGSSGGPWLYNDWTTLNEYQVSINPDDYSGYSSMQLEVNYRLIEAAGTGSVRLYNVTDASSISSQIDSTSTDFGFHSSGKFNLSSGQKIYTLQIKVSANKNLLIQSARIKVSF